MPTPDSVLAQIATGNPDCALAILVGRAQQKGLMTIPDGLERGVRPAVARVMLRKALSATIRQLLAEQEALFGEAK